MNPMQGLIASKMQAPAGGMPGEEPVDESMVGAEDDFTPQELDTIEKFKQATLTALYAKDGEIAKNLLTAIESTDDIPSVLANMAYDFTQMLDEKSRSQLTEDIAPVVAADVLGQMAEIAEAGGQPMRSKDLAKATQIMLQRYLEENGMSPEEASGMLQGDPEEMGRALDQDAREEEQGMGAV